jgi:cytoplasmic iron level regulating protein YaaA (DUF328/UPF0246 family)
MAKDLYISDLFQKTYQYAQFLNPDAIYILSAKYGLLPPDRIIEPYEQTLKTMKIAERKEWAKGVLDELRQNTDLKNDMFIFLCGEPYRKYLLPEVTNYEIPMQGLKFGPQLSWLKGQLEKGLISH